jgi:thermostable 8-oxoguanine DNA glycosylase
MVDPQFITKFDRTRDELEEFMVFSICVAGKTAKQTVKAVEKLKNRLTFRVNYRFLTEIWLYGYNNGSNKLAVLLKECGIGKYDHIRKGSTTNLLLSISHDVINGNLNLRTCTVEQLESYTGIGMKTARFFILHSRPAQRLCCPDVHILRWGREQGLPLPKSAPKKGSKKAKEVEELILTRAEQLGYNDFAKFDLGIWNQSSIRSGTGEKTI